MGYNSEEYLDGMKDCLDSADRMITRHLKSLDGSTESYAKAFENIITDLWKMRMEVNSITNRVMKTAHEETIGSIEDDIKRIFNNMGFEVINLKESD